MTENELITFKQYLQEQSGRFLYPKTPDIASRVQRKLANNTRPGLRPFPNSRLQPVWILVAIFLLLGLVALTVPPVRAAIIDFFQIGAIRVLVGDAGPDEQTRPSIPPTTIPFPLSLAGETTLAAVREEAGFQIALPAYPAGIGDPDHVFLQEIGVPVVIFAWRDPAVPAEIAMSLFIIDNTALPLGTKFEVEESAETTVNGQPALWVSGGHILQFEDTQGRIAMDLTRLVGTHTLIWQADGLTYRLEADLPLMEMIKIAESLP